MNTFYGKQIHELNKHELILLGIDIQIVANRKCNSTPLEIAVLFEMRELAVKECTKFGGDYSLRNFMEENNFKYEGPDDEKIQFILKMRKFFDEGISHGKINKCVMENGFTLN